MLRVHSLFMQMFEQRLGCFRENLKTQWWFGVLAAEAPSNRSEAPELQSSPRLEEVRDQVQKQ